MGDQQSWQKLINQALLNTAIESSRKNNCSPLNIYEYIHSAFNNAGIENRPPISWRQIFSIWIQSKGDALKIRALCIQAISEMQKPGLGFHPNTQIAGFLSLLLLIFIILPQTANTFRASISQTSILQIKPQPMDDIDKGKIDFPTSSDYLYAANQFMDRPVLYARNHGILGSDWIRHQEDETYSLQLISTSSLDTLVDFCNKHGICEKSAWYHNQLGGKDYYRLLYGTFPSNRAAQQALAKLPMPLLQLKPWARKFKQIKSEI